MGPLGCWLLLWSVSLPRVCLHVQDTSTGATCILALALQEHICVQYLLKPLWRPAPDQCMFPFAALSLLLSFKSVRQVVYRLCGLWFKLSSDASVNGALGDVFSSVPSAKFVPLVYQMASRLDSSEGSFQVSYTVMCYSALLHVT